MTTKQTVQEVKRVAYKRGTHFLKLRRRRCPIPQLQNRVAQNREAQGGKGRVGFMPLAHRSAQRGLC